MQNHVTGENTHVPLWLQTQNLCTWKATSDLQTSPLDIWGGEGNRIIRGYYLLNLWQSNHYYPTCISITWTENMFVSMIYQTPFTWSQSQINCCNLIKDVITKAVGISYVGRTVHHRFCWKRFPPLDHPSDHSVPPQVLYRNKSQCWVKELFCVRPIFSAET